MNRETSRTPSVFRSPVYKEALIVFLVCLNILVLGSCERKTEIHGKIVTYERVDLVKFRVRYSVISKASEVQEGVARIKPDGEFHFWVKEVSRVPSYIHIEGLDGFPYSSVMGNITEITDWRVKRIEVGTVFIYDPIIIQGNFSSPVALRDLVLQWETNIANIDYFAIEFLGKLRISGIKQKRVDFSKIEHLLQREGNHKAGELEIINTTGPVTGHYLLDVQAVRLINERPVVVAGAREVELTVIE